jgi:phosphoribosyl 1,2-cyclic phosphate phosphodiesterase
MGLPEGNLLIDTSPDLRLQLLREKIGIVHAVIFTHEHSDHMMGFDDLRLFQFYLGAPLPVFCNKHVERRLRSAFEYVFSDEPVTHVGAVPAIDIHPIDVDPIPILGATVIPVPLKHGPRFEVLGFRVGNIAYCTDVSEIPPASMELLQDLDVLILDALRPAPHVTHFNLEQAIEMALQLKPKQTYLTHCSCHIDYYETNPKLPAGIAVGFDGLRFPLT